MNNQKLNNILKDPDTNWKYIVAVMLVGLMAISGVLFYQHKWTLDYETDALEIWKIFHGTRVEYSIKYPQDWTIKENYSPIGTNFSIKRGEYELNYVSPTSLTHLCIFDDTDKEKMKMELEKDMPGYYEQGKIELGEYVEFGDYRRARYEHQYDSRQRFFIVCEKNRKTGFDYIIPQDYNEEIVALMDRMVESFAWVGKNQNISTPSRGQW